MVGRTKSSRRPLSTPVRTQTPTNSVERNEERNGGSCSQRLSIPVTPGPTRASSLPSFSPMASSPTTPPLIVSEKPESVSAGNETLETFVKEQQAFNDKVFSLLTKEKTSEKNSLPLKLTVCM